MLTLMKLVVLGEYTAKSGSPLAVAGVYSWSDMSIWTETGTQAGMDGTARATEARAGVAEAEGSSGRVTAIDFRFFE